jgi:hypothetical protein
MWELPNSQLPVIPFITLAQKEAVDKAGSSVTAEPQALLRSSAEALEYFSL